MDWTATISLGSSIIIAFFTGLLYRVTSKQQALESHRQEIWEKSHYPDFHINRIHSGIKLSIYNNSTFSVKLISIIPDSSSTSIIEPVFLGAKNREKLNDLPPSQPNSPPSTQTYERLDNKTLQIDYTPTELQIKLFINALNRHLIAHVKLDNSDGYQITYI